MPYLSDERLEFLRSEGVGGDGDHVEAKCALPLDGIPPALTTPASRSHEGDAHFLLLFFLLLRPIFVENASGPEAVTRYATTAAKAAR